ncbi:UbiA prenyltransferase family-domain-containing protein [Phanerochaete sordida]|uniref:UbiA prenyltransferase family-domain-containing protein n=1 Tax=Phanerochaete sordida TaxID=48140 RepID=A0A9P3GAV5_9APHY|nr:UbiA prenyltransferase family-domain-containing protein [Phanerochaete sordida]
MQLTYPHHILKHATIQLRYHAHTAILLTIADLKTIFFPISVFACATAPLHSVSRLFMGLAWIWIHQLMCNISNQARGAAEDALNKPWRPLPAGRITERQALALRWGSAALCIAWSAMYGADLVLPSLGLFLTTVLYDDLGFARHYIGKNLCNIGGYTTFEIGATKIMGFNSRMDHIAVAAVCISGFLIFTTIQAQDFADVEGDKALHRVTFPIYAPEFSRVATLAAIVGWSLFLSWFWDIGRAYSFGLIALGAFVGLRYYLQRTTAEDRLSFLFYNIWLMTVHILPFNARTGFMRL